MDKWCSNFWIFRFHIKQKRSSFRGIQHCSLNSFPQTEMPWVKTPSEPMKKTPWNSWSWSKKNPHKHINPPLSYYCTLQASIMWYIYIHIVYMYMYNIWCISYVNIHIHICIFKYTHIDIIYIIGIYIHIYILHILYIYTSICLYIYIVYNLISSVPTK